jgi:CTP:molybdopterin cytidylyltransferase MocA
MITGIILAGGDSKRMGSPKALLRIENETFANRITRIMKAAGIENVLLVAGADRDEIAKSSELYYVFFNPEHSFGQFSSLQRGVRNLPTGSEQILVWPVDLPLVQQSTIEKLIEKAANNPVVVPVFSGRKGHPVIYNSEALRKILQMKPVQTGKELFAYFEGRVALVEVEDPGVLIDIDTPEDYDRRIKRADLSL